MIASRPFRRAWRPWRDVSAVEKFAFAIWFAGYCTKTKATWAAIWVQP